MARTYGGRNLVIYELYSEPLQVSWSGDAALFVTEWGSVNADGNGGVANSETNAWVDFMKTRGISHANWVD